jgi:hypothetical protein
MGITAIDSVLLQFRQRCDASLQSLRDLTHRVLLRAEPVYR